MAFVYAYDKTTGEKLAHQVPEHWIGHPTLGKNLSKTPRQKASDKAAPAATTEKAPAAGDKKE